MKEDTRSAEIKQQGWKQCSTLDSSYTDIGYSLFH